MDVIDRLRFQADREIDFIETECSLGKIDIEDARHEIAMIEAEYEERVNDILNGF